jgi:hypothetical protein
MSRLVHKNIRREFKYLNKDFDRKKITKEEVSNWLKQRGILGNISWIDIVLKNTKVKPRIISRLARAAKKKGKLVDLGDIYWLSRYKEGDYPMAEYGMRIRKLPSEYHLIEFVKIEQN